MPVVVGKYVCHIRGLSFSRAVWFSWTIRIRRPGTNQMFYESSYPSETKKIRIKTSQRGIKSTVMENFDLE